MFGKLADKTVIVTGASRGYGKHFAVACAREGANLVITSRHVDECERVAEAVRDAGGQALSVETDVIDEVSVQGMADATVGQFGAIDILINNAGHPGALHEFGDLSGEDWEMPMRTNLIGSVNCAKAVLPSMTERGGGIIVNMSSLVAQPHYRFYRSLPYTVSKYAVEGLSRTMAVKLEPLGLRCYAFIPGLSHTRFLDGIKPGFLKGISCQYVRHVEEPMIHLLTSAPQHCPPLGDAFDALDWLDKQGKLDALTYVHDGGIAPEENDQAQGLS